MIHIITDSTSDITLEHMKTLNIDVLPLSVRFGEETFVTLYEITNEEFYKKMEQSEEKPNTIQVNPYQFEEVFQKYIDNGDEVITILLGSKLSGTCQSAIIAKNNINSDKITVIDSKTGTVAEGLLVEIAVMLRDQGKTYEEIVETIQAYVPRTKMYIVLETLDFLRHGGRISPEEAVAGEKLGIRPIIEIKDTVSLIDKAKGKKASNRFLLQKLETYGVEKDTPILLGHANTPELATTFEKVLRENGYENKITTYCMGPIVGAHLGENSLGLAFVSEKSE